MPQVVYASMNEVRITCVQDDGTPLNMTGGSVELIVERFGLKPFYARSTDVQWTEPLVGKGVVSIDLSDAPSGFIRFQLKSITAGGDEDVQSEGFWQIHIPLVAVA
jgi:hypothetical protein